MNQKDKDYAKLNSDLNELLAITVELGSLDDSDSALNERMWSRFWGKKAAFQSELLKLHT